MSIRITYPGGRTKALTLSYDDGRDYDRRLVKIFNDHGLKGTFHLNAGMLKGELKVSLDEIASLYEGHEISCHAFTHPFLERIPVLRSCARSGRIVNCWKNMRPIL